MWRPPGPCCVRAFEHAARGGPASLAPGIRTVRRDHSASETKNASATCQVSGLRDEIDLEASIPPMMLSQRSRP